MSSSDLISKLAKSISEKAAQAVPKGSESYGKVIDMAKVAAGNVDKQLQGNKKFLALQELMQSGRVPKEVYDNSLNKIKQEVQQETLARARQLPRAALAGGEAAIPGANVAQRAILNQLSDEKQDSPAQDVESPAGWLSEDTRGMLSSLQEKLMQARNPDATSEEVMKKAQEERSGLEKALSFIPSPKQAARALVEPPSYDAMDFNPAAMRAAEMDEMTPEAKEEAASMVAPVLAGASGFVADPMNLVPVGKIAGKAAPAFNKLSKLLGR